MLEALARLGAALKGVSPGAVDDPPVAVGLAQHARSPGPERPVQALGPQIGGLDDVESDEISFQSNMLASAALGQPDSLVRAIGEQCARNAGQMTARRARRP